MDASEETFEHRVTAWTVGDLRRAIAHVPDDAELVIDTPDRPGSNLSSGVEHVITGAARGHDWMPPHGGAPGRWEPAHRLELIADYPSGTYDRISDTCTGSAQPSLAHTDPAAVRWDTAGEADSGRADDVGAGSDHAGTSTPALPDAVAPTWVDGYLTGHDRGMAEGREAGYADYDRQLVAGVAGMLAGDPEVTDYREGVRRHERMADAKARRDAIRARDLISDADASAESGRAAPDRSDTGKTSGTLSASAQAFVDGRTDGQRRARQALASSYDYDDGWDL